VPTSPNMQEKYEISKTKARDIGNITELNLGSGKRIECEEEFRFKPGDIVIFLEPRQVDVEHCKVNGAIHIHKDVNYFEDHGQYR
jgi:hypothetical protein